MSRCAHGDLASQMSGWTIFAERAGFFSELLSGRAERKDLRLNVNTEITILVFLPVAIKTLPSDIDLSSFVSAKINNTFYATGSNQLNFNPTL